MCENLIWLFVLQPHRLPYKRKICSTKKACDDSESRSTIQETINSSQMKDAGQVEEKSNDVSADNTDNDSDAEDNIPLVQVQHQQVTYNCFDIMPICTQFLAHLCTLHSGVIYRYITICLSVCPDGT